MIKLVSKGSFAKAQKYLTNAAKASIPKNLEKIGRRGVEALQKATPVDSGKTADSWTYTIVTKKNNVTITWQNTNINNGANVAILLQYGHATRNGGFVQGIDYINPALAPVFNELADDAWREVINK